MMMVSSNGRRLKSLSPKYKKNLRGERSAGSLSAVALAKADPHPQHVINNIPKFILGTNLCLMLTSETVSRARRFDSITALPKPAKLLRYPKNESFLCQVSGNPHDPYRPQEEHPPPQPAKSSNESPLSDLPIECPA